MTEHVFDTRRTRAFRPGWLLGFTMAALALLPSSASGSEASTSIPAFERQVRAMPDPMRTIPPRDPSRRPGDTLSSAEPRFETGAQRQLIEATRASDTETMRTLLAAGTNPNVSSVVGDWPLSIAVRNQQLEAVRLLLLAGARSDVRAASGMTPLGMAVLNDDLPTVEALLRARADPELRSANGNTALNDALGLARTAIAERLIRAGASLEAPDRRGRRSLGIVATSGNLTLLKSILDAGVDPDQLDVAQRPPVFRGDLFVLGEVTALLEHARATRTASPVASQ